MSQRYREKEEAPTYEDLVRTNQLGFVSSNSHLMSSDIQTMTDVVTPGFRKRIASGEIINNNCTINRYSSTVTGSSNFHFYNTAVPTSWQDRTGGCFTRTIASKIVPDPNVINTKDLARVRAIAQMDRTPYAFGEDIGEIGETIKFLRHPFLSISDLARDFSDEVSKLARSRKRAKALADAWSTYRFAFMPLIQSSMNALEAFNAGVTRDRPHLLRLTARGFASDSSYIRDVDTASTWGGFKWQTQRTFSYEVEHHAQILYSVSNPAANWRFNLGLRTKDLPLTYWQLVPLSFMVDRVFNISTAVQAAVNILDPELRILSGSTRIKSDEINTFHTTDCDASPTYTATVDGGTLYESHFLYDRQVWAPGVSDIFVPFDKTGLIKDVTSIVDLAAIITQRLA